MKAGFHVGAFSGTIAASLAQNSVLFAFRNPSQSAGIRIRRVEAITRAITGPTATEQISLAAAWASAFTANYSGGTDLSDPTAPAYFTVGPESGIGQKKQGVDTSSVLATGNVMIATTAGLATATPTISAFPFAYDERQEVIVSTIQDRPGLNLIWEPTAEEIEGGKGRVLKQDMGFVIRNPIATGAGHTFRLYVRVAWGEQ